MSTKVLSAPIDQLAPIITELIESGRDVTITVTGNSMRPLWYHKKNNVTLAACDPTQLKKGDVPFYCRTDGRYVLHRIIRVNEDTFDLVGDGQYNVEYGLEKFRVIAVAKAFTKGGRAYTMKNIVYRLYSCVWIWLLPVRKYLFAIYSKLKRVFR